MTVKGSKWKPLQCAYGRSEEESLSFHDCFDTGHFAVLSEGPLRIVASCQGY